ncbi:MAG: NAD(P)H-binding protein [Thermoleophilaceae bacterium]
MTPRARDMTELVTGATGYVGGRLVERLLGEGRRVRGLARDPSRLAARDGLEPARGDLLSGEGLAEALEGCATAYYLVHSMQAGLNGDFAGRDRAAARNFGEAARAAGVERIVYLGGLLPAGGPHSVHLASRLEVEEILLDAVPGSTALRASIVIGAGSSSFRVLVRLVERLRFLPFPAWHENRTQPIDERDAIEYLARTARVPEAAGESLDIAGPDVVSYGAMIERIADSLGVARTPVRLRARQTPAASAVVAAVTGQPLELVRPLMESLEHDLLPRDERARDLYGMRPRPFDRAVERALREWEQVEELAAR